jgi:hypothetical protein
MTREEIKSVILKAIEIGRRSMVNELWEAAALNEAKGFDATMLEPWVLAPLDLDDLVEEVYAPLDPEPPDAAAESVRCSLKACDCLRSTQSRQPARREPSQRPGPHLPLRYR